MFHEGASGFHAIHSSECSLDLIQIFIKLVFAEFCNFYDIHLCRGIFFPVKIILVLLLIPGIFSY